jgi:hypothetical protein
MIGQGRVLDVGQAGRGVTFGVVGEPQVPEPLIARTGLELLHDRRVKVRLTGLGDLLVVHLLGGVHVLVHERQQLLAERLAAVG